MPVAPEALAGVLEPFRFDRDSARRYTARFLFRGL